MCFADGCALFFIHVKFQENKTEISFENGCALFFLHVVSRKFVLKMIELVLHRCKVSRK